MPCWALLLLPTCNVTCMQCGAGEMLVLGDLLDARSGACCESC